MVLWKTTFFGPKIFGEKNPQNLMRTFNAPIRKRNKLMRKNKTLEAGTISVKVGKLIAETRAQQLSNVSYEDVKKLLGFSSIYYWP